MNPTSAEFEKHYRLLDLQPGATEKDVATAYRKKALQLHPDKNRDDPRAEEKFHALQQAYQVLIDPEARAAYEQILRLRKEQEERRSRLDSKRKLMQDDLLERERLAALRQKEDAERAEEALKEHLERLRRESEKLQKQPSAAHQESEADRTIFVENGKDLLDTLIPYDPEVRVTRIADSKVHAVFSSITMALTVMKMYEAGQFTKGMKMSWKTGRAPKEPERKIPATRKFEVPKGPADLASLESQTLAKLRQAQANKRAKQQ